MSKATEGTLAGHWWYTEGRNYYSIGWYEGTSTVQTPQGPTTETKQRLGYHQKLSSGTELYGELTRAAVSQDSICSWSHKVVLNNGAEIRFRLLGDNALVTSYKRAGTEEWRPPVTAYRGEAPQEEQEEDPEEVVDVEPYDPLEKRWSVDGRAYSKADFVRFFGGTEEWDAAPQVAEGQGPPKIYSWRGEEQHQVHRAAVFSGLRPRLMGLLAEPEEGAGLELPGMPLLRRRLLQALPAVSALPQRVFDVLPPMPLTERVAEEVLDRVEDERRNKPDPKKTIVPVPTVRLMPSLAHPVSPNEEQMLRLFVGDPRNMAYNLSNAARVQAFLTPMQLEYCHSLILERHDVLRSGFWLEGTDPLRRVHQEHLGTLNVLAVRDEGEIYQVQGADYATGHQLGITPVRCNAFASHLGAGGIGVNLHHIVADADGMGLYVTEAFTIHHWLSQGFSEEAVAERLPALPVQFVDYAYWQKSLSSQGLLDSDLGYWFHQVTATSPPAVLDVPIDKPRPRVWVAVGTSQRCMMDIELLNGLTNVSGRATPFAVTLTTMAVALSRFNGNSSTLIAVPFALRSLPVLMHLIGNFLNMMPVRASYVDGDTYVSTLDRTAVQAVDVQRYSLAPFITLLNSTQKHYGMQDPSRNPIYATMIDLVPNASEDPSTGLSGVLDVFLFVNTREGLIWSLDAVYNTFVLENQTVKMMLLQILGVQYHVARSPKEPVPRQLPSREAADVVDDGVLLTHINVRTGFLPQIVGVRSGWELPSGSQEYYGARSSRRFKAMSCLELTADYPPDKLSSLRPPGSGPVKQTGQRSRAEARLDMDEKALAKAVRPPEARTEDELAEEAEARRAELTRRKQRSYEVATRWAETARQSELIPLRTEDFFEEEPESYQAVSANDWHQKKWNPKGVGLDSAEIMGRMHKRSMAGRGRRS